MSASLSTVFPPAPVTRRGSPTPLAVSHGTKAQIYYTSGRCVVIRDLADPMLVSLYTQHTAQVSAVAPAPSGYYVASADVNGHVRIWDPNHEEQIIKTQTQVFSGRVNDICWDSESQRVVAVGDGKDK
jgi:WD40 repeat protein